MKIFHPGFLNVDITAVDLVPDGNGVVFKLLPEQFFEYGAHAPKADMKMPKGFPAKRAKHPRETVAALVNRHKKFAVS